MLQPEYQRTFQWTTHPLNFNFSSTSTLKYNLMLQSTMFHVLHSLELPIIWNRIATNTTTIHSLYNNGWAVRGGILNVSLTHIPEGLPQQNLSWGIHSEIAIAYIRFETLNVQKPKTIEFFRSSVYKANTILYFSSTK